MTEKLKLEIEFEKLQLIKKGIEDSIENCTIETFPEVYNYVDEKGVVFQNPSKTQLKSGNVKRVFDYEKTFSVENIKREYDLKKLKQSILLAFELIESVYFENQDAIKAELEKIKVGEN